ncbi:MAG TPA: helix-turn-helix transcriptional regulator [Xanthobacteraceae bacterium]|nr:helix-turn-helix transcriptional regulator [Xanthobacteraceae bacterium]
MSTRGKRLVEAMNKRGMKKQHALAYAVGVNESAVTRWKRDGPMSLENAMALCQTLDISLDWFLTGAGTMDRRTSPSKLDEDDSRLRSSFGRLCETMSARSKSLLIEFMDSMVPR